MIAGFQFGLGFTAGVVAGGVACCFFLGVVDWLLEVVNFIRKIRKTCGVEPGESLMGETSCGVARLQNRSVPKIH